MHFQRLYSLFEVVFCARHGMTRALRHAKDPHIFGQTHISDIKLNTHTYIIISVCSVCPIESL